jgi:hypothetical protein
MLNKLSQLKIQKVIQILSYHIHELMIVYFQVMVYLKFFTLELNQEENKMRLFYSLRVDCHMSL